MEKKYIKYITRKFYVDCNCVYGNVKSLLIPELFQLQMLESYCMPILMYGEDALRLSKLDVGGVPKNVPARSDTLNRAQPVVDDR